MQHEIAIREQENYRAGHSVCKQQAVPASDSPRTVFRLQQQAGNQAVQAFLSGRVIQARLAISNPGNSEEREADHLAHTIMRAHAGFPVSAPCSCAEGGEMCEECQQRQALPAIHRRATAPAAPDQVPGIVSEVLRYPGVPLDSATRAFLEPRFGFDFSHVRIHTGPEAAESARSIGALAFTLGNDLVFGNGQYAPETTAGRTLLAHELVHVRQQTVATPKRSLTHTAFSRVPANYLQRDTIPGWNFTPADFAALRKSRKDLTIAGDSSWVPAKLQQNILNTLRYTLDAKRSPTATEGINVKDFYHGHLVVPKKARIPASVTEQRSAFEEKESAAATKALGGEVNPVTKENVGAYTKALAEILPTYGSLLEAAVRIKGAAVIYHTFELTEPSDVKAAGKELKPGDPRRNYMTPLATNTPKPYSPPDPENASSYSDEYTHISQFAFLVGPDGAVHVRPGTTQELSTVTGTPLE
jgi:hypothetical protein